jgi:hypothetical protein
MLEDPIAEDEFMQISILIKSMAFDFIASDHSTLHLEPKAYLWTHPTLLAVQFSVNRQM